MGNGKTANETRKNQKASSERKSSKEHRNFSRKKRDSDPIKTSRNSKKPFNKHHTFSKSHSTTSHRPHSSSKSYSRNSPPDRTSSRSQTSHNPHSSSKSYSKTSQPNRTSSRSQTAHKHLSSSKTYSRTSRPDRTSSRSQSIHKPQETSDIQTKRKVKLSPKRVKGLPKIIKKTNDEITPIFHKSYYSKSPRFQPGSVHNSKVKKKSVNKKAKGIREPKFTTLNTTNVQIVHKYFETISPTLYDTLARSGQFVLYQAEGNRYEIFLVPSEISPMIKQLNKNYPIMSAGIYLGFMKRQQTRTHFERQFFLSFEGGRFLWDYVNSHFPEIKKDLQSVSLDEEGEKAFFYGRNIEMDEVISETEHLVKKKITFVLDQHGEYIGLALLMVKQAGTEKPVLGIKTTDIYSRSPHFKLSLLNLSDGGKYLRKGS